MSVTYDSGGNDLLLLGLRELRLIKNFVFLTEHLFACIKADDALVRLEFTIQGPHRRQFLIGVVPWSTKADPSPPLGKCLNEGNSVTVEMSIDTNKARVAVLPCLER